MLPSVRAGDAPAAEINRKGVSTLETRSGVLEDTTMTAKQNGNHVDTGMEIILMLFDPHWINDR